MSRYQKSAVALVLVYIAITTLVFAREWPLIPPSGLFLYASVKGLALIIAAVAVVLLRRDPFSTLAHALVGVSFAIYLGIGQWFRPRYLPGVFQLLTAFAFLLPSRLRVFLPFAVGTSVLFTVVTWVRFDETFAMRPRLNLNDGVMTIWNFAAVAILVYVFIFHERVLSERARRRFGLIGAHASSIIADVKRLIVTPQVHVSVLKDALGTNPNPNVQALLAQLEDSIAMASRLVMDLSTMTRLSAVPSETFSLAEVIGEVRLLLAHKLREVEVEVQGDVMIAGERSLAYSVFLNLFMNTLEAIRTGGTAKPGARPAISIRLHVGGCDYSDNGPGFPPEVLRALSRGVYRSRKEHGTGLGLYLISNGVESFGGTVTYGNGPDGGASIEIAFGRKNSIAAPGPKSI